MPADGICVPPKRDFGTSRCAARRLGYINGATWRKGLTARGTTRPTVTSVLTSAFEGNSGPDMLRSGSSLRDLKGTYRSSERFWVVRDIVPAFRWRYWLLLAKSRDIRIMTLGCSVAYHAADIRGYCSRSIRTPN